MKSLSLKEKKIMRVSALLTAALVLLMLFPAPAAAYFNRGAVKISLGRSSLTETAGSTSSVSVSVTPIKQDQLPGCGMAECPQTCGDGCLDANGECTCGGTQYRTYYSEVSCSSSKSSVATASYANGTLTVKAHSEGTAVITVTGKMRQYTDGTAALHVTVKNSSAGNGQTASSGGSTSASPDSSASQPSAGSVSVEQAAAPQTNDVQPAETENGQASGQESPEGELRDTERGRYRFVTLSSSTDIPKCFKDAADEQSHLVFQKKNGDNIEYSWTFDGSQLNPDGDYSKITLGIGVSSKYPDLLKKALKGKDVSYLSFDYSGELPASAEIYVNVSGAFDQDRDLRLYRVSSLDGGLTEKDDHVEMSNGYATFSLRHCSNYLLTDSAVRSSTPGRSLSDSAESAGVFSPLLIAVLTIAAAAAVIFLFVFFIRPQKKR